MPTLLLLLWPTTSLARPPATPGCDRLAACPPGSSVCVACDGPGAYAWRWSDAPGSPLALGLVREGDVVDCRRGAFDPKGNLFAVPTNGERIRLDHDDQGRVTRVRVDEIQMCEQSFGTAEAGGTDWTQCGPPDGTWDRITPVQYETVDGRLHVTYAYGRRAWRYDERGRLIWKTRAGEESEYTYVGDAREPSRVVERAGGELRYTLDRRYDERGHLVEEVRTYRGGPSYANVWRYDEHGMVVFEHIHGREARSWTYEYDARGLPVREVQGEFVTEREYDRRGFLIRERTSRGEDVLTEVIYERDSSGRLHGKRGRSRGDRWRENTACLVHLWDRQVRNRSVDAP